MGRRRSFFRKLGLSIAVAISTLSVAWCLQVGNAAAVDLFKDACRNGTAAAAGCSSTKDDIVSRTVGRVTNLITFVSGIAAVIMIMVGGFMYITANGDASKVSEAKNTIVFSLIGILVVVLARYIILFVINKV